MNGDNQVLHIEGEIIGNKIFVHIGNETLERELSPQEIGMLNRQDLTRYSIYNPKGRDK